jgi:outer membrane protein assembly factor BamB
LWLTSNVVDAQQWPQWRGPARDGVAAAQAPAAWPAALTKKWKIAIGSGYATPIVADGRVYVHARTGENETIAAYDVATGKPLWSDAHPAAYKMNPAAESHGPGPKSSPVLANGRLYTFGISGILSCLDAASGKVIWRKQPSAEQPLLVLQGRINDLGRELCVVAGDEEEIWISNYPVTVMVFKPTLVAPAEGGQL